MKEYIKLFETLNSADGYAITATPFTSTVKRESEGLGPQNIRCNEEDKKLAVTGNTVDVVDNGPEMVDLGLSVMWAKCNLGAKTETEYGDYYAWGEVETKYVEGYGWSTYLRHSDGLYDETGKTHNNTFKKYIPSDRTEYVADGYSPDDLTTLEAVDDAATQILGDNWRMPTKTELNELMSLPYTFTTKNGVNGWEFTGNGNTLFIPAAGSYGTNGLSGVGERAQCWSSTLNTNMIPVGAWALNLDFGMIGAYGRDGGLSVRPVYDPS